MRNIFPRILQIFIITAFLTVLNATGATLIVTKTANTTDGVCNADCSLREAITAAAPGDTIEFASPLFDSPQTIATGGELKIEKNLTINGKGASLLTLQAPGGRAVYILNTTVNLSGITVTGGYLVGSDAGGILSHSSTTTITNCLITGNTGTFTGGLSVLGGTVTVTGSTVSNNTGLNYVYNSGYGGGGIYNQGTLFLINSTVSGNSGDNGYAQAGGIYNNGTATITNSTVADNEVRGTQGTVGIYSAAASRLTIKNSIVANRNNSVVPDFAASSSTQYPVVITSGGYNLIGNPGAITAFTNTGDQKGTSAAPLNPQLAPLGNYGGKTPTHAVFPYSPANDAADPNNALAADQRGVARPVGGRADIGAFERNINFTHSPVGVSGALPLAVAGQAFNVQFTAARLTSFGNLTDSEPNPDGLSVKAENFAPFTFSLAAGNLPAGLILNSNGNLSGTPTAAGTYNFALKVTDADGIGGANDYTLIVAPSTTLTVTKTADTSDGVCDSDCSLREAIAAAASNDTIAFAAPLFDSPQVITLSSGSGQLLILKNLTINGKGANLLTVRRTAPASMPFRIFAVGGTANVTLQGMTVTGGRDTGGGGGILNDNSATLTINNCHITGNIADLNGGGVRNVSGTLNINNTTISGNLAGINNGAGVASTGGTVNITGSTISGNETNSGNVGTGGIWASSGALNITSSTVTNNRSGGILQQGAAVVTVRNSIVAANYNNAVKPDVVGAFVSGGYNLIGNAGAATGFNTAGDQTGTSAAILSPRLFQLADNGGTTPTHKLRGNSSAIDKGKSFGLTIDQRGQPRPFDFADISPAAGGDNSDIGAFELQTATNTVPYISASQNPLNVYRNSSGSVTITAEDDDGENLTFINTIQPSHGTISFGGATCQIVQPAQNCSITVTYTPNVNYSGADSFQFKVNDGQADSQLLTVSVDVLRIFTNLLVTKTADTNDGVCDSDCSLREAVIYAPDGENIGFAEPLFNAPQVITLSDAAGFRSLEITKNLNIYGTGAKLLTVRRAAAAAARFRIFRVGGAAAVGLRDLTIAGGADEDGGGILVENNAELTLTYCHLAGNTAVSSGGGVRSINGYLLMYKTAVSGNSVNTGDGGGIAATGGTVEIGDSTISGNTANNNSGGIWAASGSEVSISASTVTGNLTGGIKQASGAIVSIDNSIVAANDDNAANPDVVGAFVSGGYNLIGNAGAATGFNTAGDQTGTSAAPINPRLAPLGDFGGRTPTHALFGTSPAVNAANPNNTFSTDQRDVQHSVGGRADIGAFEKIFAFSNNPTGAGGAGSLPNGNFQIPYSVQFSAARPVPPSFAPLSNNFAPLVFSIIAGSLPPGLTLDANSGVLSGTPTQSGTFNFIIKVSDAANAMGGAQTYSLIVSAPTAAGVYIGGRVFTPDGRGLRNARVTLTDQNGAVRTALTSAFGYYRFDEVAAGQTVIVQVVSKRYSFQPQIVNLTEDLEDFNFTALPDSNTEILARPKEIRGEKL